jgi:spore maturation protein SpmB
VLAVERKAAGWEGQARALVVVGMLDFVAAFGTAILSGQGFPLLLPGEVAPVLMQQLPMAMIPAFGVPLFIILHLMAWQKLPPRR